MIGLTLAVRMMFAFGGTKSREEELLVFHNWNTGNGIFPIQHLLTFTSKTKITCPSVCDLIGWATSFPQRLHVKCILVVKKKGQV